MYQFSLREIQPHERIISRGVLDFYTLIKVLFCQLKVGTILFIQKMRCIEDLQPMLRWKFSRTIQLAKTYYLPSIQDQ